MNGMETRKVYTTNKYGISIVKCCASCKFKLLDIRTRICIAGEGTVQPSYVCKSWKLNPIYENLGRGTGKVKTSEYLHFALNRLFDENINQADKSSAGISKKTPCVADVREEFAKKKGKIYAIENLSDEEI